MPPETALAEPISFAHLAGIPPAETAIGSTVPVPGQRAEGKEVDDDGGDEEMKRQAEEEEVRKGKKARRAKKAKKRDDEDDGEDDPEDDEEDEEEDMKASSVTGRARRRERARCAAIFAHQAAAGNAPLAAHFAFSTAMTRHQAIAALEAAVAAMGPRARRGGLDARMDGRPAVGGDAAPKLAPSDPKVIAAEIVRNYEEARGLNRK
jgi:hypothetical protein